MPNKSVTVDVTLSAKGNSIDQGLNFAFALPLGSTVPAGVLTPSGTLNLNNLTSTDETIDLEFDLKTTSVTVGSGSSQKSYDISFYTSANGAKDALLLAEGNGQPGVYSGSEFTGFNLGQNNGSISVTDSDNDSKSYQYALVVAAKDSQGNSTRIEDDPRIVNTGSN